MSDRAEGTTRLLSIALLVVCQSAAISIWFVGSAATSAAVASGQFSAQQAGLLSSAVQLGFVTGTLVIALTGAADRFDPRRVFAASAVLGAASTAALIFSGLDGATAVLLRTLSGFTLAGVYPVGMKLVAGWSRSSLGLPMGLLVGALTLGSALPNLFVALDSSNWIWPVAVSSALALTSAMLIGLVALGPNHALPSRFRLKDAIAQLRRPEVGSVTRGYLGHMWELYAMWAWLAAFLHWAAPGGQTQADVSFLAFTAIASGAAGCIGGGWLADRFGKDRLIFGSLLTSGLCAATIGLAASWNWLAVIVIAHVWGMSVIADSGNFSALTSERTDRSYVGTVLTLQVSAGFLTTFVAIQLIPIFVELTGWRFAFAFLALGPLFSVVVMWRRRPES